MALSHTARMVHLPSDLTKIPNCARFIKPSGEVLPVRRKFKEALEVGGEGHVVWITDPESLFIQGWGYEDGRDPL